MAMTGKTCDSLNNRFVEIGELIERGDLEWNPSIVEKGLQMIDELKPDPRSIYYRGIAE